MINETVLWGAISCLSKKMEKHPVVIGLDAYGIAPTIYTELY